VPSTAAVGLDLPAGSQSVLGTCSEHPCHPRRLDPLHAVLADPAAVAIHGLDAVFDRRAARLAIVGEARSGYPPRSTPPAQVGPVTVIHRDDRPPNSAWHGHLHTIPPYRQRWSLTIGRRG